MSKRLISCFSLVCLPTQVAADEVRSLGEPQAYVGRGSVCFSPDGRILASNTYVRGTKGAQRHAFFTTRIRLWDVATGERLFISEPIPGIVSDLAFVDSGRSLVGIRSFYTGDAVVVWSVAQRTSSLKSCKLIVNKTIGFASKPAASPDQIWHKLAVSPKGDTLAAVGVFGNTGSTTVTQTWSELGESTHHVQRDLSDFYVKNVCWSPDGKLIVAAMSGKQGKGIVIRANRSSDLDEVAFRIEGTADQQSAGLTGIPQTSWIAFSDATDRISIFDVDKRRDVFQLACDADTGPMLAMSGSPDGRFLAVSHPQKTHLWDLAAREVIGSIGQSGNGLAFTPDGTSLAVIGPGLHVWDISEYVPKRETSK